MKTILSLIISGALVASGYAQTRNVLVGTNNAVVQPTSFWSADASNARSGLGLGSAATNASSAFQPASSALTNLVSGNGGALTNLQSTNLVGLIPTSNIPATTLTNISGTLAIISGGTGATNASNARVNLGATTIGNALFVSTNSESARSIIGALSTNGDAINLTNFPPILLRTNGSAASLTNFPNEVFALSNSTGVLSLLNGGTGATNASGVRTNLGLGTAATNPATAFQPASTVLSNLASSNGVNLTNLQATNIIGTIAISNGGTGSTTAGGARTNLGLGATNSVSFQNISLDVGQLNFSNGAIYWLGDVRYEPETQTFQGTVQIDNGSISLVGSNAASNIATTRTNLGLGWPALTNSNAGTGLVSVNTNGEVVSPTNFWQAAPITTTFIESQPTTNFTTNITPARFLHIHSLATNIINTTNTIVLPTNTLTFEGDVAIVVHKGPTNSMTRVQRAGSTNNLITLTRFDEAVQFVYYNDVWQFDHNVAFVEPIYFAGTNTSANAAASRTNLGLGKLNNVEFADITAVNILGAGGTNVVIDLDDSLLMQDGNVILEWQTNAITAYRPIVFNNTTNAATTRTNLGLGETNNVTFSALTLSSDLTLGSGDNIVLSTTTGTKIGTATNQLLGFYNQTPITQPSSTGVTTNGFTGGGGGATVHPQSTFTGGIGTNAYTISDIVAHLKSLGLIAQ